MLLLICLVGDMLKSDIVVTSPAQRMSLMAGDDDAPYCCHYGMCPFDEKLKWLRINHHPQQQLREMKQAKKSD